MSLNGTVWAPIGPSPLHLGSIDVNGQVTSIAVNPNNPKVIYIGTAWGGIWRTRDGGTSWTPLFDRAPSLGIGEPAAIAIDPIDTSIIYAGTSSREGSQFSGNATQPGAGLFKSTDGGASWVRLGSFYPSNAPSNAYIFFNQSINVVIVDPSKNQIVYLASDSGFFRSTDGGLNWTQAANGTVDTLVLDPTSPAAARILYAGVSGVGVLQSTNGGQNWVTILSKATAAVATRMTAGSYTGFSKVVVALAPPTSPANPGGIRVLYATMVGTPNVFGSLDTVGVFLSQDQGNTWIAQAATGITSTSYGGYAFHMAVDPDSPGDGVGDIIYFGALAQVKSTDAGATFVNLTGLHADTHTWGFAKQPPSPTIIFCGNDGGIFQSTGGLAFSSLNGGGLQTALFYNIDVKPDLTASVTLGALQDNGVVTTAPPAVSPAWQAGWGGDGFDVAHDGQLATQAYARSNGSIGRSTNDGDSYPAGINPPFTVPEQKTYLAAVATDPSLGNVVYVSGSQNLYQSTDGGATWPNHFPLPGPANGADVAPTNGNNVAVAVGSQVFVSTDALVAAGFTFKDITRNLPGLNVTRVAFDPTDPTVIYAVLSGFSGFLGGHVFRTTLTSSTWKDISPPVDLPFNAVALDSSGVPTVVYAGTDFGVLRTVDGGATWSILDDIHFPGAPVFDLAYHNGELRAATFGRGVFSFVKPLGPSIALNLEDGLAFGTVCKGPQYLTLTVYNVGAQDLVVTSVQRLMGSTDFTVLANPATPLVVQPGEDIEFTVEYSPTVVGVLEIATIRIISNDPTAPFVDLAATGTVGTPRLVTSIVDNGFIGNVCLGSFAEAELTINNSGTCPLTVFAITSTSPQFLAPQISAPLLLGSGESTEVTIRFQPVSFGAKAATITLFSNDPAGARTVAVSGFAPAPKLALVIANTGNFGNCCVGSFKDEPLILSNSGRCTLTVTSITSSSGEFLVPLVLTYPLTIEAGGDLEVPIRFQPASFGAKAATITVTSDDPAGPHAIALSGHAPSGKIAVTGSAYFGGVKCCRRAFRTIAVCNVGDCDLHVTKVAFERENRHWRLVHNPFPATLHPGSCLNVTIRYKATQKEPRPCEVVIWSDDPLTPVREVDVIAWTRCCCKRCCEECRAGCCCQERHKECCEEHHRECCEEESREGCREAEGREKQREERHEERHHREHHHGECDAGDGDED